MALTRTVSLKMFADTAAAQSKLDAIAAEAEKLGKLNPSIKPQIDKTAMLRQLAVLRGELKAQGDQAGQDLGDGIASGTKKGLGSKGGGSWIAGAIGLGAPLLGPLAAGGVAFGAFGALAAGSLAPVVKAMSGPGGLSAGWSTLNARQKTAATGVEALKTRYDALSASMQPRTFQVFNTGLSTANSLLGPLGKLAATSGGGVERFLVQFENDAGLQKFIGYASTIAPQAIGLLGTDVTTLIHSVLTLAQAMGGSGLFELRLLTSGLQILDKVITALPGPLEATALGVGGLAVGLSKIGALAPLLKITGLANVGKDALAAAKGVEGLALAEKGAAAGGAALDAVSPVGWALLATAAVAGLAVWMSKWKTATDVQVASIESLTKAQGFNTAGYLQAAESIGAVNDLQKEQRTTLVNLHTGMTQGTVDVGSLSGVTETLTAAQQANLTAGKNTSAFLGILSQKYGISGTAAVSLATHSGVLASQVKKGGQSMADAVSQAEAYADSNVKAQRPTSQLASDMQDFANKTLTAATRTTALSNALSLFFNPAVSADQALITLAGDGQAAAKAIDAAGGKTERLTGKQGAARGAFDTYISQVGATASQVFAATGKTGDYNRIIDANLPRLEKLAGHNKALRQEIQKLIDTENKMPKSENVAIHVSGSGSWAVVQGGHRVLQGGSIPGQGPAAALGMMVTGGRPGVDSVPILAQQGELVVPTPIVRSGAVDHLRGKIPGFAQGGVVGSYGPGSLGGLGSWIGQENSATLRAIESATAMATLAGMRKAQAAASFGAAGPGGGAPAANAALARRMFPGEDFASWNYVAMRESGWNQFARNASSGAYGIAQALPPTKYPFAGQAAGGSNPAAQISWMEGYMQSRYGGAAGAAAHERSFNWYGSGTGGAAPGWAVVGERGAELVRMRGGEDVIPAGPSAALLGVRGYAKGTLTPKQAAALAARQLKTEETTGLSLASYYASPGTNAGIRAEETRYLKAIAKYFDGSSAKSRDKAVERQTGRLLDIGSQIRSLGSRLASARSYQQSVQSGLSGYADLSTTTLGGSMTGTRQVSAGASLQGQLGQKLANLKKFGQVLGKLAAAHADSSLIRQVVAIGQSDPVAGAAYGQELLSGGPRLIRALNREESAIGATELNISRGAASSVYEGRYQPGKHFLQQLQGDKAGLDKLFRDLGKTLGEEAVKWFRVPKGRRPKGFASGGVLTRPVYGWDDTGQSYTFAENGPERIVPGAGTARGPLVVINGMVVREEADISILSQKLSYAVTRAGLG